MEKLGQALINPMRLRNRHLVCLLLLLSTLSAADARSLRSADLTLGGRYISTLLSQTAAAAALPKPLAEHTAPPPTEAFLLPPASRALHAAVWTMRPPALHTAALQAFTTLS
jgi:hypothetical protein